MKAIRRRTLDLILNAGMGALPNEFGGILRAYDGVITEVMVLPGTEQGNAAAIFKLYMLPVDPSVVGTAHSHPSGNYWPSGADLELFDRFGHIQVADPSGDVRLDEAGNYAIGEEFQVDVPEGQDGKVWSLAITRCEDSDVYLFGVPGLLAQRPEALLEPRR